MSDVNKMRKKTSTTWEFKHRGVECQVVFWFEESMTDPKYSDIYPQGGIWNAYFFLREEHLGDKFKQFVMRRKKDEWPSGHRYRHDYLPLARRFEMHGGITFYELIPSIGRGRVVKIGCDYNHIWDHDMRYDASDVAYDLRKSVDEVLEAIGVDEIKNDYS